MITKRVRLEKAYERNYQKMIKARPGSKQYNYYAICEQEIHNQLRVMNFYWKDPCPLYLKGVSNCNTCTGWYGRGKLKIDNEIKKYLVEFPVGEGRKCKIK